MDLKIDWSHLTKQMAECLLEYMVLFCECPILHSVLIWRRSVSSDTTILQSKNQSTSYPLFGDLTVIRDFYADPKGSASERFWTLIIPDVKTPNRIC